MSTIELPDQPDAIAPDGSEVRVLVSCRGGSMAHFQLAPNETSVAVAHRTLEELWYFVDGEGEMWRRSVHTGEESVETVHRGVALAILPGTHFQFRSFGPEPLAAVGTTVPPWPGIGAMDGTGEVDIVTGPWEPTVRSGMQGPPPTA